MSAATPPVAPQSGSARLHAAAREARNDAAPFALAAAAILIALALVAKHAGWEALGQSLWWMWLVVAAPYLVLAGTLLLGLNRLVRHDHRREIVIGLLTVVWVFNVLGVGRGVWVNDGGWRNWSTMRVCARPARWLRAPSQRRLGTEWAQAGCAASTCSSPTNGDSTTNGSASSSNATTSSTWKRVPLPAKISSPGVIGTA
jgi:hypothetical protein